MTSISGASRVTEFLRVNTVGDEYAVDAEHDAPLMSVRMKSPMATTRLSGAARATRSTSHA